MNMGGLTEVLYTLRSRLVVTFVLLLVVPFIVLVTVYNHLSNAVIGQSISESTAQMMNQYTGFIDTLTTQMDDVANQILSNDVTQEWIASQLDNHLPTSRRLTLDAELRKYLSSIALNNSVVSSISVFNQDGLAVGIRDQIFRDPTYLNSEWYRRYVEEDRRWVSTHWDPYQPEYLQQEQVVSLLFPMQRLSNFKRVGVMKVNVAHSIIQEPLEQITFGQSGRVYMIDRDGKTVIAPEDFERSNLRRDTLIHLWDDPRQRGEVHVHHEGKDYILFFQKLKADWLLIGEVPEKELFHTLTSTRNTMLIVGAALLVMTLLAAYWLSSGIAKPLSKLAFAMRHVEREDFNRAQSGLAKYRDKPNEIGYVTNVFLRMVSRLRFLIETEYKSNMKRKDAEFKALLMQINPHFLYNTLEIIGALSAQGRKDEVIDVSESLGRMLRFSLKLDNDFVRLNDELQYLREYVSIMELRFKQRLHIEIHDSWNTHEAVIVKFMLQPLVENAIKYSIEFAPVAKVQVRAERVHDQLQIQVEDNGIGMSESFVHDILHQSKLDEFDPVLHTQGKRIGLRNVLARCRLMYGDKAQIVIHSVQNKGTLIQMTIPFHTGGMPDAEAEFDHRGR